MTTAIDRPIIIDVTPTRAVAPQRRLLPRLAMIAITLLAFGLRVERLGVPSLWLDEMGQATPALRGLGAVIDAARRHHGAAPLDYLLTWLALHVAHNDFVVRLPAALLGTLTVVLVYLLAREVFDELPAVLAALLLAVAPLHLRYSQEARFYALFTCVAVASTLALVVAMRRNDRRVWVAYALLLIAGLYSHYYMPLVVAAQGAGVLAASILPDRFPLQGSGSPRRALRGFLISCVAAAVAFLPWLLYAVLNERRVPRGVVPELNLDQAQQIVYQLFLSGSPLDLGVEKWLPWLYVLLLAAGVIAGLARPRTRTLTLSMGLLVLLSPLVILLMLRWIGYFFEIRQLLFLLPFALILVASGAVALSEAVGRTTRSQRRENRLRAGGTAFLALLMIGPLWPASQAAPGTAREDWRGALRFVAANAAPGEVVLVPGLGIDRYLGYYTDGWAQPPLVPATAGEAAAMSERGSAAWIVTIPQTAAIAQSLASAAAMQLDFDPKVRVTYVPGEGTTVDQLTERAASWAAPDNAVAAKQFSEALLAGGRPEAAERMLAEGTANASDPRQASLMQTLLGNRLNSQGKQLEALAIYRNAVALWPDNAEARVRLGDALLRSGDPEAAGRELARAVALAPDHFWAHRYLGQAYLQLEQPRQAAQQFEAALAIDPAVTDTLALLGDARAGYGDRSGAATAYRQFLEQAPHSSLAQDVQTRLDALTIP